MTGQVLLTESDVAAGRSILDWQYSNGNWPNECSSWQKKLSSTGPSM